MILNSIIIDDDLMARKSLIRLCEKTDAINLVGEFENAELALDFLNTESVDLIFLDMEMPGLSGLDFIKNPHLKHLSFLSLVTLNMPQMLLNIKL